MLGRQVVDRADHGCPWHQAPRVFSAIRAPYLRTLAIVLCTLSPSCSEPKSPAPPREGLGASGSIPGEERPEPVTLTVDRIERLLRNLGHDPACYEVQTDRSESADLRDWLGIGMMGSVLRVRARHCPGGYDLVWWSSEPMALEWYLQSDRHTPYQQTVLDAAWEHLSGEGTVAPPRSAYHFRVKEIVSGIAVKQDGGTTNLEGVTVTALHVLLTHADTTRRVDQALSRKDAIVELATPQVLLDPVTLRAIRLEDYVPQNAAHP